MHLRFPSLVLAVAVLASPCRAAPEDLSAQIKDILDRPEYRSARWGILAVDVATGRPVFEHNADALFAPASVTKLYSCAAALADLGPDHVFETPVYRRGPVEKGQLDGDLILIAHGDLTLGGRTDRAGKMAFRNDDHIYATATATGTALTDTDPLAGLKSLAHQIKESGITSVTGDVLIDDRLFERSQGSGSGPGILTPIVVNDNIVDVIVTPGEKAGVPASVTLRPRTDIIQVDAVVETTERNLRPLVRTERVGPGRFVVRGRVPVGSRPVIRICAVDDPTAFARALFIEELRREGVQVRASGLHTPRAELPERGALGGLTRVAVFRSPPFSEALKVTLKVSHNLYASTLPLLLAVKEGKRTLGEGMRRQGKVLADLGVSTKDISLESGAGGGNGDRVSPRTTVALLLAMSKRPDFAVYKSCLPVLGVDGTLAGAVGKDSPAVGKVWAKTGTYTDRDLLNGRDHLRSKALAGYISTTGGKTLAFTLFVNDVSLPPGISAQREGKVLGRLCEILQQQAP
jgi:D-alanyl-D-alanine carboxypeptidase/D-alanyl-D-alanine-endopeptidase (penicillin-binding protein 4)